MDGVIVQSNQQSAEPRPSLVVRSKGANNVSRVPREIQNVQQSKSVSFGGVKPSMKPSMKLPSQPTRSGKFNTPGGKFKIHTPSTKSNATRKKPAVTPFKIHEDVTETKINHAVTQKTTQNKHDEPEEKEYMALSAPEDWELAMPDYLQRVMDSRPIIRINTTPNWKEIDVDKLSDIFNTDLLLSKYTQEPPPIEGILDGMPPINYAETNELLQEIESDDSFSLEVLDDELRAAGLDVPTW